MQGVIVVTGDVSGSNYSPAGGPVTCLDLVLLTTLCLGHC